MGSRSISHAVSVTIRSVANAHGHPQRRTVLVGPESRGADAVSGELLVALLRVTGDADGAITSQPLRTFPTRVEDDVIYVDLPMAEERMP